MYIEIHEYCKRRQEELRTSITLFYSKMLYNICPLYVNYTMIDVAD